VRETRENQKSLYIKSLYASEDNILKTIVEQIETSDYPIQITAIEGKFLQFLILLSNANKIVELGTHLGYSSIWMAKILKEDGIIYTIEKDEIRASKALENFKNSNLSHKIKLINTNALEGLEQLTGEYDLLFIDAVKSEYIKYLEWADKHIKKGGLIIADNTLLSGAVFDTNYKGKFNKKTIKSMQDFNLSLSNKEKYHSIMLPTEEGLSIAIKK
jgi:predicted O-methyltransferase YrrM